jgi:acyl carrier protein
MKHSALLGDGYDGDAASPVQRRDVRDRVIRLVRETAANQNKALLALSDELPLLESGLDSLCFAIIVAELEDELGVDPFSDAEEVFFPVTFGEFVALYEAAARAR